MVGVVVGGDCQFWFEAVGFEEFDNRFGIGAIDDGGFSRGGGEDGVGVVIAQCGDNLNFEFAHLWNLFLSEGCFADKVVPFSRGRDFAELDEELGDFWRSSGLSEELHTGFFGGSVSLSPIAAFAAGDDIFPGGSPSSGAGDHMVEGQLARREAFSAVLTAVVISQIDILTGEFYLEVMAADEVFQSDNRRDLERHRDCVNQSIFVKGERFYFFEE